MPSLTEIVTLRPQSSSSLLEVVLWRRGRYFSPGLPATDGADTLRTGNFFLPVEASQAGSEIRILASTARLSPRFGITRNGLMSISAMEGKVTTRAEILRRTDSSAATSAGGWPRNPDRRGQD